MKKSTPTASFRRYCFILIFGGSTVSDCFLLNNNNHPTYISVQPQHHHSRKNDSLHYTSERWRLVRLFLSQPQYHSPTTFSDRSDWSRRRVLTTTGITWTTIHSWPQIADSTTVSAEDININVDVSSLNCLLDLPSYDPSTTVRLYLCRHGETDYNRNNIIQGARIDPPINDMGMEQAKLLGQTLYRSIPQPQSTTSNSNSTMLILHSPLQRAKQTAEIVAEQLRITTSHDPPSSPSIPTKTVIRPLDALTEVDFGSIAEGAPVQEYRTELLTLYTAWAVGNYNARMSAGGESGFEILNRISKALYSMIDMAAYETDCSTCVAITHSSYLRILLGAVQDFALFSATTPQSNCGINVIDFPHPSTTIAINRFSGEGKNSNEIMIPKGAVIRTNEKRHLGSIQQSERQQSWSQRSSSY